MSRVRLLVLCVIAALIPAVLFVAPAHAAKLYLVSGTVIDGATAQPVEGAKVTVRDLANPYMYATATTNPWGDFGVYFPETVGETVQIVVRQDRGQGELDLQVITDPFQVNGQRHEVITLQTLRNVQAKVVLGPNGPPVSNAWVTAHGSSANLPTESGLNTTATIPDSSCRTNELGACTLEVLAGGTVEGFEVDPVQGYNVSFSGMETTTPAPLEKTFVLPASHAVTGVLLDAAGSPVAGANVSLTNSAETATAETTTAEDGSYSVSLRPSEVRLRVRGVLPHEGDDAPFDLQTDYFALDRARTVPVSLPAMATLRVLVRDGLDQPVTDAAVTMNTRGSTVSGTTPDGLPYAVVLFPDDIPRARCASTDEQGACDLPIFLGGDSAGLDVQHPVGGQLSLFGTPAQPGDVREVYARYPRYAQLPSAGSSPGRFVVTSTGADIESLRTSPVTAPPGVTAPLGRIDYALTTRSSGSTAGFSVRLPAGIKPNAVFEVGQDGHFSDVTDTVELSADRLYTVRADGGPQDADGVANLRVVGAIVPAVVQDPLRIVTTSLPGVPRGKEYAYQMHATGLGAPYTWEVVSGSLPPGLTLSADGVVSGTTSALGAFAVAIGVRNSFGRLATATFVIQVSTVVITTWEVPGAYQGSSYSTTLKASGASLPSWRVFTGNLPPGISLTSGGRLWGSPTSVGSYDFGIVVTSGNGTMSPVQYYRIVVRAMDVATASLPDAPIGASYSQTLTANGGKGTLVWSVADGALPPGLTLSSSGVLTGRPTAMGTYDVTVKVTDASSPKQVATRTFSITVTPMVIVTSALPTGKKGAWYASQLVASGGKPTLAWALAGGALPTGLNLSSAGRITGYPKATGTWTFTVRLTDASVPKNEAMATLTLTVS